jgi:hypothetical protein
MRTLDGPRRRDPGPRRGMDESSSDEIIAIILENDLVSRERAEAACSRVRGFGKTKADLLGPNGDSAISDRFGNLNAYFRCSFAADSQQESFLVNFRLYSSLTFSEGTVVGTHMQALLPKLGWPEARRARCSGRPAAFLFRRCYSDSESRNFNRLHLIRLARTRAS